jgi:putative effector of murein hydrolase
MERETLRKLFVYASVISGIVAAYLMYRRGESLGTIATKAITNPVGSLISEVSGGVVA